MTRPITSSQLDGFAVLLGKLAVSLTDNGRGRTSLRRMKDHHRAQGFPRNGSGSSPMTSTGLAESSSTERAALDRDPTLGDYDEALRLVGRMMHDAGRLNALLAAYDRRVGEVCPACAAVIPHGRVRCGKCDATPTVRVCGNPHCLRPLAEGERLIVGRDGVEREKSCYEFHRRHGRDRTADEAGFNRSRPEVTT